MHRALLSSLVILTLCAATAQAGAFKIPEDNPVVTVDIPGSWSPEYTDRGVSCESADKVATVFFEIAKVGKDVNSLIDESVDWLVKEQKVKVKAETKKEKDIEIEGVQWHRISWDADSADWGPSVVGFMMVKVSDAKLLLTTYWITKEGADKQFPALEKILTSIKGVKS